MNPLKNLILLFCCLLLQNIGYSQRMSKEEITKKLYGLWHFEVDSSYKNYAIDVLDVRHKGDSTDIKEYDSRNFNGYILFEITDSTNSRYNFGKESKTGYYLLERECTLPECHDPRVDRVIVPYNIESVIGDSLTLYFPLKNQNYILTKGK